MSEFSTQSRIYFLNTCSTDGRANLVTKARETYFVGSFKSCFKWDVMFYCSTWKSGQVVVLNIIRNQFAIFTSEKEEMILF